MVVAAQLLIHVRRLSAAVALLGLAACAASCSSADRHLAAQPAPARIPVDAAVDASYDWHVLLLVPFGVLLKQSPIPLHEVLLFHDAALPAAEVDNKDCYAIGGPPPRFLRQLPDPYLLCFSHDRLSRVEAAVRLAAADAPQVFARACALWLKSPAPAVSTGTVCEGSDGGVSFSAKLAATTAEPLATVSMTLINPPPAAVDDAPAGR